MTRWTLGFLVGVMVITHFSFLPSLQITGWCITISSTGFIFFHRSSFLVTFFIACFLGFSWALTVAHYRIYHGLPAALEGQTLTALGMVASVPEYRRNQLRFDFLIKKLKTDVSINYPLRVRLSEYRYKDSNKPLRLKKGDVWQFTLRLKRPRGFWSPGSFDYAAALFQQNIQVTGYIVKRFPSYLIQASSHYYYIDHLRQNLTDNIKKSLKDYPLVGLITALITGIRYDITDAQWQVMRGTGTNHLFAISGLHLAFIASIIYFITHLFWSRIPYAPLLTPASNVAAVLTGLFAIFYAVLTGFALPIQRALLMLLVFLGANLLRRNLVSGAAFHFALLIILVYAPFSVLSASFWLSFMAVGFILYSVYGRFKQAKAWWVWGRTQFCVGFGLTPVSLLFFHQVSWISFIANAIAIPSVGFVILPLAFLGGVTTLIIPTLGNTLLISAERLLEHFWQLLTCFSTLQWTQYTAYIATPWILVSSMLGLFLLLAPLGVPSRFLSVFYLLPLFFCKPNGPRNGEIWFSLLDVGQGLAAVVQTQHHTLVYDTGPNRTFDAGRAVLLPYLQQLGIQKLDMLMVSHGDNDHVGGAYSLLAHMPVTNIISSIPKKFIPRPADFCHEKMNWQWDKVNFEILYPVSNNVYLGNNSSCVLKISNLKHSILLTGDIEKSGENYLVKNSESQLASTILVVPHHGSKTSSSIEFLNKVRPTIALFPTGYHNQFKFPHMVVLKRYRLLKSTVYDTAIDGTIILKLHSDSNIQVETYRQKYYCFWQG